MLAKGDHKQVISLVETWEAHDTPTVRARLAQIRSFLNLRMTDRAWTRLNGLSETDGQESERLALEARMFIARGWSGRARDLVTRLQVTYPDHPDAAALSAEIAQDRDKPPSTLPDAKASREAQLEAAEAYLSANAYLKAKRLLDRMRSQFPEDPRVAELHWALAGDYEIPTSLLVELVDAHGHVEPRDENTADGATTEGAWDDNPYDADEEVSASENTMITRMADLVNMAPAEEAPLDADEDDDRGDDTRILTVFGDDDGAPPPRTDESHHQFHDTASDVEREDDHIVVMTGREGYVPPPQTNLPKAVPVPAPRKMPQAGPALELLPVDAPHRPPAGSWAIALIASIFLVGGALMILLNI